MGNGRDDRDFRDNRDMRSRHDEPRGRSSHERSQYGRDDHGERGFFERAGDEISSWFGDDEAERRRERDERSGGGDARRGQSTRPDERGSRDGPSGRPFTGRPFPGQSPERSQMRDHDRGSDGSRVDMDRDQPGRSSSERGYQPMTGDYGRSSNERNERFERESSGRGATGATAAHDRHYSEWRQRQIDEIDRDYEDYRREHQSKFESDFSNWRSTRQSKRQMLGQIKEQMQVFGSDDQPVGTVDKVRGDRLILTKNDSPDGKHHSVNCAMIDRVEGDRVILDRKGDDARAQFGDEDRDRALFERDNDRSPGAHILDRSFSGTY